MPSDHIIAFANLGNTCFMNAALQALRLTPGFLSAILEDFEEYDLREPYAPLIRSLHDLYKEILATPSKTLIRPRSFLEALIRSVETGKKIKMEEDKASKERLALKDVLIEEEKRLDLEEAQLNVEEDIPKRLKLEETRLQLEIKKEKLKVVDVFKYKYGDQMDIDEFLIRLLDQFHECISRRVKMDIEPVPSLMNNPIHIQQIEALNAWKDRYKSHYSSIVCDFHHQTQLRITCNTCGYMSSQYGSTPIVQARISPSATTLIDCFRYTFNTISIDDYDCPTCLSKKAATQTYRFSGFPKNLIIMISRFENSLTKNERFIGLDLERLDLRPFLAFQSPFSDEPPIYQTYAVIHHHGHSLHGGHYTMMGRQGHNWYHYNDGMVNHARESDVMTKEAYMLFLTHKPAYSRFQSVEYPRYQAEA